jgi:hypothetical protein
MTTRVQDGTAAPDPSYGRPDRWCRQCGARLVECPCCEAVFCSECGRLADEREVP